MATANREGLTEAVRDGQPIELLRAPAEIIEEWGREDLGLTGSELQQLRDLMAAFRKAFGLVASMNARGQEGESREDLVDDLDQAISELDAVLIEVQPLQRQRLDADRIYMREEGELTDEWRLLHTRREWIDPGPVWQALEDLRPPDTDEGPVLWDHPIAGLVWALGEESEAVGRCAWCKQLMVKDAPHQRYCSDSHRQLAYQARRG